MSKQNSDFWGLLFDCPLKEETEGCILKNVRKLPITDRVRHGGQLNDQERNEIIKHHRSCLIKREQKVPFSRIAIM